MRATKSRAWFSVIVLLAGCSAFRVAGYVQTGRQALLVNDPERALPYFLEAAQADPNYSYQSMYFREGVWTYVGRTQYATGRLKEARESLEKALAADRDDLLARLYLGLTLARGDDLARGLKEIDAGTKAIYDWLEWINRSRPFDALWDPLREIRNAIEKELEPVPGKELDRAQRIANAEWLGNKMEDEMERVRQDEQRRLNREFDRGRGVSAGIGIGF